MKIVEVPKTRKESGSHKKFPWDIARQIHEKLFPKNAEFYKNADRETVGFLALVSLNNMVEATNPEQLAISAAQFYETQLYIN